MDRTLIITVVSLLLVLVVTGMIAFLVSGSKSKQKKRMMHVIRGAAAEQGPSRKETKRDTLSRKLKESGDPDAKKPSTLPTDIMQAGLTISVAQFWIFSVVFAVVATITVKLMGYSLFVVIMTAIISFMGVPRLVIKRLKMRRQKKFLAEMADSLDAMTRLLRAGMPVSEAIKMVGREFEGPIGEEMERIFDQQKIGVSLPEAVLDSARRMPIPEMQMFATAVAIQAQTGSSLSEILEGLARVIRARFRLRRKVQALSSEAKWSAIIIGALPLFVITALYFLNPDYIMLLFTRTQGQWMLICCGAWMSMGVLIMKQMINFKI